VDLPKLMQFLLITTSVFDHQESRIFVVKLLKMFCTANEFRANFSTAECIAACHAVAARNHLHTGVKRIINIIMDIYLMKDYYTSCEQWQQSKIRHSAHGGAHEFSYETEPWNPIAVTIIDLPPCTISYQEFRLLLFPVWSLLCTAKVVCQLCRIESTLKVDPTVLATFDSSEIAEFEAGFKLVARSIAERALLQQRSRDEGPLFYVGYDGNVCICVDILDDEKGELISCKEASFLDSFYVVPSKLNR
jgi:hypothetical protein